MQNKRMIIFSSLCTYLCFLGLILLLKKPLCIDSTIVQRLDRVVQLSPNDIKFKTETAYSCSLNRQVEYSNQLDGIITKISTVVDRTTTLLNSIKPFKNKLQIIVREDRPLMFQVDKNKINIGVNFINLDYHLSRAIIKTWIFENKSTFNIDTSLFEESMTDLLLYVLTGKIEIEDPVDKVRTKLGSVKWPQVIKITKGYCLSAWKYAEHTEYCNQASITNIVSFVNQGEQRAEEDNEFDLKATVYSLRPLLTSSLIASFNELTYIQKQNLIKKIPFLLANMHLQSEKAIESMLVDTNPLHNGILNINKFTDLILSSTQQSRSEVYQLYTGVTQHLQQYGVTDTFAEAYFDYMIEYNGKINESSSFYKTLALAASKNPDVQIALKDLNNIWILPSRTALPITIFNQIQSRQTILLGCDNNKNIRVDQFFKKTEKLMMINECDQTSAYEFEPLFHDGIKAFIGKNHKFKFVQLHIPSLEMIQKDLGPSQNFFELVKNRDISKSEFKKLGWSKVQWRKDLQAYRPEAVIEAIEYFRN